MMQVLKLLALHLKKQKPQICMLMEIDDEMTPLVMNRIESFQSQESHKKRGQKLTSMVSHTKVKTH
jgi:hypothetical protein